MRDPDFIQHANGPYRLLKLGDDEPVKFYVGSRDRYTFRIYAPNDGQPFMIDDPVLGAVVYDENLFRIIPGETA